MGGSISINEFTEEATCCLRRAPSPRDHTNAQPFARHLGYFSLPNHMPRVWEGTDDPETMKRQHASVFSAMWRSTLITFGFECGDHLDRSFADVARPLGVGDACSAASRWKHLSHDMPLGLASMAHACEVVEAVLQERSTEYSPHSLILTFCYRLNPFQEHLQDGNVETPTVE